MARIRPTAVLIGVPNSALTMPVAARGMTAQMDHEGLGGCTNIGECAPACPKEFPLNVISQLNKDLRTAIEHGR